MSYIVNQWQESFNRQYAKSTVKKEIEVAKKDVNVLEKAGKGQIGYTDFLGITHTKSFEEVFKEQRGVKFDEKAIADCREKAEQFAAIKTSVDMIKQVKELLDYTTQDSNHRSPDEAFESMLTALRLCGITEKDDISNILADIHEKYKDHPAFIKNKCENLYIYSNKNTKPTLCRFKNSAGQHVAVPNEVLGIIADELYV